VAKVVLDCLTKHYDGAVHPAVDAVSLEIAHGEFMVLLGPSGCGKTTTLRMVAGLESISGGNLSIDGQSMNAIPAKDRDIAMVFQSYALYPHMSVAENLAFGLKRRNIPRAEISKRVEAVASKIGLIPFLERRPHALSGGQRQRVALGRAIVREPKVFLFDEPLSNLDAALRATTRAEISKLHRELGATMIYVTHDQVEAMTMGTRICIMNGGRIAQVGHPLDVYNRPANTFVAAFLGNPAMNLLPAENTGAVGGRNIRAGQDTFEIPPDRAPPFAGMQRLTLGIRPEHVRLGAADDVAGGFAGTVVGLERLGAETLVTIMATGLTVPIMARIIGQSQINLGETVTAAIDLDQVHLFDADGNSLTFSLAEGAFHG
jgi:multiple sugar transport system ATP-binding protein